jgi:hypothetical protein
VAEPASRDRRNGNIPLLSWDPSPCADQCPKLNAHAKSCFRAGLGAHLRYQCMASLDLVGSPLVMLMGCKSGHDVF